MAVKIFPFQTNFTGGELSPRLFARADLGKYQHGVKLMENFIPTPQGGAFSRPGTKIVDRLSFAIDTGPGELSLDTDPPYHPIRLHPFEFNVEQAYILAFVGRNLDGRIYIYANGAPVETSPGSQVRVVVTTPYTINQIWELEFAQSADVLEIVHKDHPIKQLRRLSSTNWVLVDKPLTGEPMDTRTKKPTMTLTLSAGTGLNQTATTSAPYWLPGDVGRNIEGVTPTTGNLGRAVIIAITSPTVAQIDITKSFAADLSFSSGEWSVIGNGAGQIKPSDRTETDQQATWKADIDIWKSEDIGDHLVGWGGATRIDAVDSLRSFRGIAVDSIDDIGKGKAAKFFSPIWPVGGFPSCVCYFQGRLYVASTITYPQRIWGSEVGFYNNFRHYLGIPQPTQVTANSPVNFTISDTNFIRWIIGTKVIFIGGAGGIYVMSGGSLRDPIKHDNIQVVRESSWGVERLSPILIDDTVAYVQRGGHKVRNIVYNQDGDGFKSTDLMLFADHLGTESKIRQLSFAQSFTEKYHIPVLFALRDDGVLLAQTYQPDQEVAAWARITARQVDISTGVSNPLLEGEEAYVPAYTFPDGNPAQQINRPFFWKERIISVATIPHPSGKGTQTWIATRRHRPGNNIAWYLEYFDEEVSTDAAITYNGVMDAVGFRIRFAAATGNGVAVTVIGSPPTPNVFLASDVGKAIKLVPEKFIRPNGEVIPRGSVTSVLQSDPNAALAIIKTFVDPKNITVDIVRGSFNILDYNPGEWGIAQDAIINDGTSFAHTAWDDLYSGILSLVGDGVVYPRSYAFFPNTKLRGGKYPFALKIEAGTDFRRRIEMVRPAQQIAAGNSLFLVKGYNRVYALIHETVGLSLNGEPVYFREMNHDLDAAIPKKSGIVEITNLGHDRDAEIVIEQPVPLPALVLGVMGSLEVGEE